MGEVVGFHDGSGMTDKDIHPDLILEKAKGELKGLIMAGYDKDGDEVFYSSYADISKTLWLLERFKKLILADIDE